MLCFVASRMSFVKSFETFWTLSHLLSSRALRTHTANSVIITIKLIYRCIISGRLVSVMNCYVRLHVPIFVLDPRISYQALQEDFADDTTLVAQLETSKLDICSHFDMNYSSPQNSSNSACLSSTQHHLCFL
jgi:hypothetical protein